MLGIGLKLLTWINKRRLGEHPIAVLYFHRVLDKQDPFTPDDFTKERFEQLIKTLSQHFTILPLSQALEQKFEGKNSQTKTKKRTLCLTFDDGYLDNFTTALPLLDKYDIKASFFVATDGIEQGYLWSDELEFIIKNTQKSSLSFLQKEFDLTSIENKSQAYLTLVGELKFMSNTDRDIHMTDIHKNLAMEAKTPRCMMSLEQLNELQQQGHDIGAHTKTHSILAFQSDDVALQEIKRSQGYLNKHLAKPVDLFAYPNGWLGRDFNERHQEMIRSCGFKYGVATNDGGIITSSNPMALPRFMPYRKQLSQFCLSVAKIAGEINGTKS